jgi:uncharacterized protein YndB with AHSA1/START domain
MCNHVVVSGSAGLHCVPEATVLTREVTFPVPATILWDALTDPAAVSRWIGADVDWDLTPGGRARFRHGPDGDRAGRVDAVEVARRLRFRWWPEADRTDESEVSYELEPTDDGTRLTVTERRVAPVPAPASPAPGSPAPARASAGTRGAGPGMPPSWTAVDSRLFGLWAVACLTGATR